MDKKVKIRATLKDGVTTVKALMTHPMETGARKDKESGELVPAEYIQEVTVNHNDAVVLNANWGTGISKNPYLSFKIKGGAAGDTIMLTWKDNLGESGSGETNVKQK
jgi:sulfur-oxidizing protein SoxZ|tara:strand:+ start:998 stop:1318 length:321 start_codon:yes stop_codon:yes gene_type:complete